MSIWSSSPNFLLPYVTSDSTWWRAFSEPSPCTPYTHAERPAWVKYWNAQCEGDKCGQSHWAGSQCEFAEWALPSRCLQWKRGHRSHTSAALKKAKSKYHQTVKLNSALSQSSSCFPDLQLCLLITGGHPRRDGRDTVTENKKHRSLSYLQMGGGGFRWTETTKVEHCHLENKL